MDGFWLTFPECCFYTLYSVYVVYKFYSKEKPTENVQPDKSPTQYYKTCTS